MVPSASVRFAKATNSSAVFIVCDPNLCTEVPHLMAAAH